MGKSDGVIITGPALYLHLGASQRRLALSSGCNPKVVTMVIAALPNYTTTDRCNFIGNYF